MGDLLRTVVDKVVLVTGGAGFIGGHLVDKLIESGAAHVVVVDNMFLGDMQNISQALSSGKVTFYRDDIELSGSLDYIFEKHEIDVVFNCATKALNYSFLNPGNAFTTNVTGVVNLLELQRKGVFKSLCHFSTSEVYGTAVYEPIDEAHPRNPTTTYAAGKAAADLAVESYVRMFELDAIIVRPFNNYGPRQNYQGQLAGIIPLTAWRIFQGQKPEIHGTGLQSRDFIHVKDTVDATLNLFKVLKSGENVNISTDGQVTVRELISLICQHYGYQGEILEKPGRVADVFCHNASNEKAKSLIDYQLTSFEDGLKSTLDWYQSVFEKNST